MTKTITPVIYLTGAPASGKSTLTRGLKEIDPNIEVFCYSERLRDFISRSRKQDNLTQTDMRASSASIITREDVNSVDEELIQFVEKYRGTRPVVIDSHAVTKESFGFRVTPFSAQQLRALAPDIIIVLYLSDDKTRERILTTPDGRPEVTLFEAGFHTALQSSLALQYGLQIESKIYFVDTAKSISEVAQTVARLAKI